MRNYKDSCISLEVLKQDSGLLPAPYDNWNTFTPEDGDYAQVGEQDYQFVNGEWVEAEAERTNKAKRNAHAIPFGHPARR